MALGEAQALAGEVSPFGIKVTLMEPDAFSTHFGGSSARFAAPLDAYAPLHEAMGDFQGALQSGGDPVSFAAVVLELVDLDEPPLRQFFGPEPLNTMTADYEARMATWRAGQDRAIHANA
ncbi:hypothetical protein [Nocardioides bruguierae]|uniref:Uncharacterized protein n=1 Tax=Nocardioides bruguierae TaxID=2945102 RepID=A0A9X2DDM7_9ACTN|nr:hypothetical protein [Nocardioides bruguierae]MCM0622544.1 hypothetical protein [Nocardioides bruguierae]